MSSQLLEIQPRDVKFIFEFQKQSSCTVKLFSKIDKHVAFKVKTTSPKKYCVKPSTGIVQPKGSYEFVVIMQAQQSPPQDMACRDKFLVQSTTVSPDTEDDDIRPEMFSKGDGKYVEEKKMKVILVTPSQSPELSPMKGALRHRPTNDGGIAGDELLSQEEHLVPAEEHILKAKSMIHDYLMPVKDTESGPIKDAVSEPFMAGEPEMMMKEVESKKWDHAMLFPTAEDAEQLVVIKVREEMKARIHDLESKLRKAEVTMSKVAEERRSTARETEILRRELALMKERKVGRRVKVGYPLLFVCMVAFASFVLGFLLHG